MGETADKRILLILQALRQSHHQRETLRQVIEVMLEGASERFSPRSQSPSPGMIPEKSHF